MKSDQKPKAARAPAGLARLWAIAVSLLLHWPFGAAWAQGVLGNWPATATPVYAARGAVPLVMLTMARDHTLFFPGCTTPATATSTQVSEMRDISTQTKTSGRR